MENTVSFSQLYAQIDDLRRQVAQRGVEIQASRRDLLAEVDAKVYITQKALVNLFVIDCLISLSIIVLLRMLRKSLQYVSRN